MVLRVGPPGHGRRSPRRSRKPSSWMSQRHPKDSKVAALRCVQRDGGRGPASPISSIWDSWRVRPPMRANRQIFSGVSIGNGNYDVAQIAAISPAPPSWVTRSSIAPQKWVPRSIVGATEIRQEPGHPGQMVAWRGAANLLRGAAPRGVRPSPAEPRFYSRAWSIQGQNEPCRCGCDLKRLKR